MRTQGKGRTCGGVRESGLADREPTLASRGEDECIRRRIRNFDVMALTKKARGRGARGPGKGAMEGEIETSKDTAKERKRRAKALEAVHGSGSHVALHSPVTLRSRL